MPGMGLLAFLAVVGEFQVVIPLVLRLYGVLGYRFDGLVVVQRR